MDLVTGHLVVLSCFSVAGVGANAAFIYNIKRRPVPFNAIDMVQVLKTGLALVGGVVCVWMELLHCPSRACQGATSITDDVLYLSACPTFLAVAYIRWRVCECRGNAVVLVTIPFAVKVFSASFLPVCMFVVATIPLMSSEQASEDNVSITADASIMIVHGTSMICFEIAKVLALIVIPLIIGIALYVRIVRIVIQSTKVVRGSISQRRNSPFKVIVKSVSVLVAVTVTIWSVFTVMRISSLFIMIDRIFFVYCKAITFLAHPFANGLLTHVPTKANQVEPSWVGKPTKSEINIQNPSYTGLTSDSLGGSTVYMPRVIEETQSTVQISKTESRKKSTTFIPAEINIRTRRQSVICARPSVLVWNADFIGLETRDSQVIPDLHKTRKDSTDRLKRKLRNIEGMHDQQSPTNSRRHLSQSLRFAHIDGSPEDEIYEQYRNMYSRRTLASDSDGVGAGQEPYSGLRHAADRAQERQRFAESTGSPSSKRWKKLYKTAKASRHWSRIMKPNKIIHEEESDSNPAAKSVISEERTSQLGDEFNQPCKLSVASSMNGHARNYHGVQRGSIDSVAPQKLNPRSKQRSISCVHNEWMEHNRNKADVERVLSNANRLIKDGDQDRSTSFDSNCVDNTKPMRAGEGNPRRGGKRPLGKSRKHWLLDERTTREECIQKLMDMKNFF